MKKHIATYLVALTFFLTISQAQFFELPRQMEAVEFKERSLIVQLMPQNEDSLREYRKDDEKTEAYLDRLDKANENFRANIEKYWKMHDDIQFLQVNEMEPFFDGKNAADYVIMDAGIGYGMRPEPSVKNIAYGFMVSFFFAEEGKPLFSSMILPVYHNDLMFEFYLTNIQKYIELSAEGTDYDDDEIWNYEKNLAAMQQNTLLIPADAMDMEENKARELYTFPMELVSSERFVSALRNRESSILAPMVLFHMKKKMWVYAITNPSTMEIVSLFPVNSGMDLRELVEESSSTSSVPLEMLSIQVSQGFGKSQFKAMSNKGAFKQNY